MTHPPRCTWPSASLACIIIACGPPSPQDEPTDVEIARAAATRGAKFDVRDLRCTRRAKNADQLARQIERASPGTTICLAPGRWKDARIEIDANGTSARPIVIAAEKPGKTILSGTSQLRLGGSHLIAAGLVFRNTRSRGESVVDFATRQRDCRRCRITDSVIVAPDAKSDPSKWITLRGSRNRVDHCWFSGKVAGGATVVVMRGSTAADEHLIDHNYFGPREPLGRNGAEAVRIGTGEHAHSDSHTIVEHNMFERVNGEGEIISNKSGANILRYNTFVGCRGALTLRNSRDARVEGNYFFGSGEAKSGGIRIFGQGHVVVNNYMQGLASSASQGRGGIIIGAGSEGFQTGDRGRYPPVKDLVVAFNTIVDSGNSLIFGGGATGTTVAPRRVLLANNIVADPRGPAIRQLVALRKSTIVGNIVWGELGIDEQPGLGRVDPKLRPVAGDIWRPAADSPIIGKAVNIADSYDVRRDIEGQGRGKTRDIGADERRSTAPQRRPMTAADVGPLTFRP